uniref:CASPASE_P20 domain-containing protein n=1 Tax=Strongyloides venezuelensis TaxID=75913 RepID=A0A0K0F6P4_STRVS
MFGFSRRRQLLIDNFVDNVSKHGLRDLDGKNTQKDYNTSDCFVSTYDAFISKRKSTHDLFNSTMFLKVNNLKID